MSCEQVKRTLFQRACCAVAQTIDSDLNSGVSLNCNLSEDNPKIFRNFLDVILAISCSWILENIFGFIKPPLLFWLEKTLMRTDRNECQMMVLDSPNVNWDMIKSITFPAFEKVFSVLNLSIEEPSKAPQNDSSAANNSICHHTVRNFQIETMRNQSKQHFHFRSYGSKLLNNAIVGNHYKNFLADDVDLVTDETLEDIISLYGSDATEVYIPSPKYLETIARKCKVVSSPKKLELFLVGKRDFANEYSALIALNNVILSLEIEHMDILMCKNRLINECILEICGSSNLKSLRLIGLILDWNTVLRNLPATLSAIEISDCSSSNDPPKLECITGWKLPATLQIIELSKIDSEIIFLLFDAISETLSKTGTPHCIRSLQIHSIRASLLIHPSESSLRDETHLRIWSKMNSMLLPGMECLTFRECQLESKYVDTLIATILQEETILCKLKCIDLSNNNVDSQTMISLLKILGKLPSPITTLAIGANQPYDTAQSHELWEMINQFPAMHTLNLTYAKLCMTSDQPKKLPSSLVHLNLSCLRLKDEDAQILARVLANGNNTSLKYLNMSYNLMTFQGISLMVESMLSANMKLSEFDLTANKFVWEDCRVEISEEGGRSIKKAKLSDSAGAMARGDEKEQEIKNKLSAVSERVKGLNPLTFVHNRMVDGIQEF